MSYPAWVDEHLPPRGPCGICGGPDARHRLIDAVIGQHGAGETIVQVARDYGLPTEFVRRLVLELPKEKA